MNSFAASYDATNLHFIQNQGITFKPELFSEI